MDVTPTLQAVDPIVQTLEFGVPLLQSADPVSQAWAWAVEAKRRFATPIALVLGLLLAWNIGRRLRSGEDPSLSLTSESEIGYMSVLLSGVHVTAFLSAAIAWVTWPAPLRSTGLAILLLSPVAVHIILEKREAADGSQGPLLGGGD